MNTPLPFRDRIAWALVAAAVGWLTLMLVVVFVSGRAPASTTSVAEHVYEYAPNYGTPIPCGASTSASDVFVTVSSTAFGPAPQSTLTVSLDSGFLWSFRMEPGGVRAGTHEDGWSRQRLTAPGRWLFHVDVFDDASVHPVDCTITKRFAIHES